MRAFKKIFLVLILSVLSLTTQADENNTVILYGEESLVLDAYTTTTGGMVGTAGDMTVGGNVEVTGSLFAGGDIFFEKYVTINGSVFVGGTYNDWRVLTVTGGIFEGSLFFPNVFIPRYESAVGDTDVTVPTKGHEVLSEGSYGHVVILNDGTLELEGGHYSMKSLRLRRGAGLIVNAPVLITLKRDFQFGTESEVILDGDMGPLDVVIYTRSSDVMSLDWRSDFRGVLFAPNGVVEILSGPFGKVLGAAFARELSVSNETNVVGVPPCLVKAEVCGDGVDQDCDGLDLHCDDFDDDGDGFTENEGDCNDFDEDINPDAVEICDEGGVELDNDCDDLFGEDDDSLNVKTATTWHLDADGDGFGSPGVTQVACLVPDGYVGELVATDCDDGDAQIHPEALELCDALDNDCDGDIDEELDPTLCVGGEIFPADPVDVASDLDTSVVTTMAESTEFLYTGVLPIQTGVDEETIVERRAAVIRGRVLDRVGNPLADVNIRIKGRPEFGMTKSRADGFFDMAVNGGGLLTVVYEKTNHLTMQRKVKTRWQRFSWAKTVRMTELDGLSTPVDLSGGTPTLQSHRGTPQTDVDGSRQATVMFPAGRTATMTLPDGTEEPLTTLTVRATEYTNRGEGAGLIENPREMLPGELPSNSGYTYAVELSVDEAIADGATKVTFNEPVYFYVENFLEFPVGEAVPSGYYDAEKAAWIASTDGVIIRILGDFTGDGATEVDINGDGLADTGMDLADIGMTFEERENLTTLYTTDQTLWRVPIPHFTPWDHNWPYTLPADSIEPELDTDEEQNEDECHCEPGSILQVENQSLTQSVPIVGTDLTLNYQSERVSGRQSAYRRDIQLIGDTVPGSLNQVTLTLEIAGQQFVETFDSVTPNQTYTFQWDGLDVYGRKLQGQQELLITLDYTYNAQYVAADDAFEMSFASFGDIDDQLTADSDRNEIAWSQQETVLLGVGFEVLDLGFGGWSLSTHHLYDGSTQTVYSGTGQKRQDVKTLVLETVAGTYVDSDFGLGEYEGDGGPAAESYLSLPTGVKMDEEGNIYIADLSNLVIRKIDTDGIITTFAGIFSDSVEEGYDYSGDGSLATETHLTGPHKIEIAPDGTVYFIDIHVYYFGSEESNIRKINLDGTITTLPNGGYATDCSVGFIEDVSFGHVVRDIALDNDGNLYVADEESRCVRKIDTEGNVTLVAGDGAINDPLYEGPATDVNLYPLAIDIDQNGNLYIADYANVVIRKVDPSGMISTIAGTGESSLNEEIDPLNEGALATEVNFLYPTDVVLDDQGLVYIVDGYESIYQIDGQGVITRIAGDGTWSDDPSVLENYSPDGTFPYGAHFGMVYDIDFHPSGELHFVEYENHLLRKITSAFPTYSNDSIYIASQDGTLVYQFSQFGQHQSTVNARTGQVIYSFAYDDNNFLSSITDADGNTTLINRSGMGELESIVGPYGQTTTFTLNADGYLETVTNPNDEIYTIGYQDEGGLLTSFEDPNHHTKEYVYDPQTGHLTTAVSATDDDKSLAFSNIENGYAVTTTTATGAPQTYEVVNHPDGTTTRISTDAFGLATTTQINSDGTELVATPNGVSRLWQEAADPRFGMQSPYDEYTTISMGALENVQTTTLDIELADDSDSLSLTRQTTTNVINGRVYTRTFNYNDILETGTEITQSPEMRQVIRTFDVQNRPLSVEPNGIEKTTYAYTPSGQLDEIIYGETTPRVVDYTYYAFGPSNGLLESITNPLLEAVSFVYDDAGRVTTQTRADLSTVGFGYDNAGNLTTLTTPHSKVHGFLYNENNQRTHYTAPYVISDVDPSVLEYTTQYDYNADQRLELVTRADGQQIDYVYEEVLVESEMVPTKRLDFVDVPLGQVDYAYDVATGQLDTVTKTPEGNVVDYDYNGNLVEQVSWTGEVAGSVQYGYGNNFWIREQKINNADLITFDYDDDGLLTSAGSLTLIHHPDHGLLTDTTLSTITTNQTYTVFGELWTYSASRGATSLYDTVYTYDELGRVDTLTETVEGVGTVYDYDYDELGRLEHVTQDGVLQTTYIYDANGNRLNHVDEVLAVTKIGVYDDQDRLKSYGDNVYTYNDAGDLLTKTDASGVVTTYGYDVFGNLKTVSKSDGSLDIHYVVDAGNRRIGKKSSGVLTQGFLYKDQLNPIAELNADGTVKSRFVYADKDFVPSYMIQSSTVYRIISDHLGSVRLVIRAIDGMIMQRMDYDEFGQVLSDTNPGFQPFGFAGGLYDTDTELVRFGARDYDAQIGRWTAKDPIGFGGGDANLYLYAYNNPIQYTDPNGALVKQAIAMCIAGYFIWQEIQENQQEFVDKMERQNDCVMGKAEEDDDCIFKDNHISDEMLRVGPKLPQDVVGKMGSPINQGIKGARYAIEAGKFVDE